MELLEKLSQAETLQEARLVVISVAYKLNNKLQVTELQLEEFTETTLYFTAVAQSTGNLVVLEYNVLKDELFMFRQPELSWIYIGKLN